MKTSWRYLLCVCVVTFMDILVPNAALAWEGVYYTHGQITDDAASAVAPTEQSDYPDIHRFRSKMHGGTMSEKGHNVPGDKGTDDNPIEFQIWAPDPLSWWKGQDKDRNGIVTKKGVIQHYDECDFQQAYLELGYLLHLVQDTASPPHVKVVYHGWLENLFDSFECYLIWHRDAYGYANGNTPPTFTDHKGRTWSYWLNDDEDDDAPEPPDNRPDSGDGIVDGPGDDVGAGNNFGLGNKSWGTYGWGWKMAEYDPESGDVVKPEWLDLLPGRNQGVDSFSSCPKPAICQEKLNEAYVKTKTQMKARSEMLPPIVPDGPADYTPPSISPVLFGPKMTTHVSFTILENRQRTVKVAISADSGGAIKDVADKVWDAVSPESSRLLGSDSTSEHLPWKASLNVDWSGALGSGEMPDGKRTITMTVQDADGNWSTPRTREVKYDKTSPTAFVSIGQP